MQTILLIEDPLQSGAWNMAADEWLLTAASDLGSTMLRLYRWNEPTLSLGYFQSSESRQSHPPSLPCPWVRRASGGGAILHHHEVTYALATPLKSRRGSAQPLYHLIHQSLVDVLVSQGLPAQLYEASEEHEADGGDSAFLCFARRAPGDVILHGKKILGSAQRRSARAVVQHGSLLLRCSEFAPELPGIQDLAGKSCNPAQLVEAWLDRIAAVMSARYEPTSLADPDRERINYTAKEKFGATSWNLRR